MNTTPQTSIFPAGSDTAPPIDAVRPGQCLRCGAGCGVPGALVIIGHGVRSHTVVMANDEDPRASLATTWSRRFKCKKCSGTFTIGPPGVLRRYLYSLGAILTAWLLALRPPLGEGLNQEAVYDHQGVDRRPQGPDPEPWRCGCRRWRSLMRWAAQIEAWWPTRPVSGTTWSARAAGLLHGFLAGGGGREGLRSRAITAHAGGGVTA